MLNYEDSNLVQLTEYCFSILELKAKLKNLNLSVEYSPDFPRKVNTDPNRVSQIIINLLSNSIKYTQEGYVKLYGSINYDS